MGKRAKQLSVRAAYGLIGFLAGVGIMSNHASERLERINFATQEYAMNTFGFGCVVSRKEPRLSCRQLAKKYQDDIIGVLTREPNK